MDFYWIIPAIITGAIGYFVGAAKTFREAKQNAYTEILPSVIRMAFGTAHTKKDEGEFNKALSRVWLYGNREVVILIDKVAGILVDRSRGDIVNASRAAVIAVRQDIQEFWKFWSHKIKPEEIKHLYMRIGGIKEEEK